MPELAAKWLAPLGPVETHPTTGPHTAGAIARDCIDSGADLIVVLGGDGTINETANGMVGSAIPLAPLPGGTANVLCCEMGMGGNPEKAARKLLAARPERIAIGRMLAPSGDSRYFLLMAGTGVDALVVEAVDPNLKKRFGKLAYWVAGLSMVGRSLPQLEATGGGQTTSCSFLLASRVRNYGGDLEIAKNVSLLHPHFEIVTFAGRNSMRYLPYLLAVGLGRPGMFPGVSVLHADNLACGPTEGTRIPVQVDGELAGHLPAEFHIVPDALTLLVPDSYRQAANRILTPLGEPPRNG